MKTLENKNALDIVYEKLRSMMKEDPSLVQYTIPYPDKCASFQGYLIHCDTVLEDKITVPMKHYLAELPASTLSSVFKHYVGVITPGLYVELEINDCVRWAVAKLNAECYPGQLLLKEMRVDEKFPHTVHYKSRLLSRCLTRVQSGFTYKFNWEAKTIEFKHPSISVQFIDDSYGLKSDVLIKHGYWYLPGSKRELELLWHILENK